MNKRARSAATVLKLFPELFAERNRKWHALILAHPPAVDMRTIHAAARRAGRDSDDETTTPPNISTGPEVPGRRITRSITKAHPELRPG